MIQLDDYLTLGQVMACAVRQQAITWPNIVQVHDVFWDYTASMG